MNAHGKRTGISEHTKLVTWLMQGLTNKLSFLCSTLEETGLTQLDFKAAKVPLLAEDGEAVPIKKHLSQATPLQIVDLCRQRLTVSVQALQACCVLRLYAATELE